MRLFKVLILLTTMLFFIVSIPSAMAADATACWKKTTTRGAGIVPICAPGKDKDAGLCYDNCPAGYNGVGPVCWKPCPAGYKDDGATCRKDVDINKKDSYGRGVGKPMPCKGETTERDAGLCYKPCKAGYDGKGPVCWQNCPAGYKDDGATCRKDAHIVAQESKGRGVGTVPKTCPSDKPVWNAGLCYKECPTGYKGVGPVCWKTCASPVAKAAGVNMPTECGAACSTTSQSCATFTQQLTAAGLKIAADIVIAIAAQNPETLTDIPDQIQKYLDVPYCE
jgi:hypothetical protein